jgi:hypothetical protein
MLVARGGGRQGLLFVNKKKQKNFMMALRAEDFVTALRAKNFMTALRALGGLETLPSPSARRREADEVFCALYFKKALLACLPIPAC